MKIIIRLKTDRLGILRSSNLMIEILHPMPKGNVGGKYDPEEVVLAVKGIQYGDRKA